MSRPQYIRRFVPIVLPLVAASFALSAGPACAAETKLCNANEAVCAAAHVYPSGTALSLATASGSPDKFATSITTITCNVSLGAKTTAMSGSPLPGKISSLTFTGCLAGGMSPCTVTAANLPWNASLTATGSGSGTWVFSSGGTGNPGRTMVCGSFVNCTETATTISGTFTGGTSGTANLAATSDPLSGGCGNATWSFKMPVSSPTPVWVEN